MKTPRRIANAFLAGYCAVMQIFAGKRGIPLVRDRTMLTGMLIAVSFLATGAIAFTYLKNG